MDHYTFSKQQLQDLFISIIDIQPLKEPQPLHEPTILKEASIIEEVKPIGFNSNEFNKFFNKNKSTSKQKITEEERIKRNNYHRTYYKNNIKKNKS